MNSFHGYETSSATLNIEGKPPLVTIITATFNAARTLEACLKSVQEQDYPNIEHLIIDGGSQDRTVEILQGHAQPGTWISEKDSGIYDAWNKGLERAHGEWIAFLGADDRLLPGAVSAYMQLALKNPEALYLSSRVRWIGPSGSTRLIGKPWKWPRFQRYMCTAHVASMHHRRFFEQYGKYDTALSIVADYEMLLRAGPRLPTAFMSTITVEMQGGGNSDNVRAVAESALVKVTTGRRPRWLAAIEYQWARASFNVRRAMSHAPTSLAGQSHSSGHKTSTGSKRPDTIAPAEHVGYLDSLRGLAILGVLGVHSAAATLQTSRVSWPVYAGMSGVELFYAVSAFTLFLSMDARAREPHATTNFLVRRFFRIAPLFYLAIALNWGRLRLPFVHGYRPHPWEYIYGFVFLFGFKPALIDTIVVGGWSIAAETAFYLLLPTLHKFIQNLRRAIFAFAAAYLILVPFSLWLSHLHPEKPGYFGLVWFPMQLPMFLMGIVLYFTVRRVTPTLGPARRQALSAGVLLVSAVCFFAKHFHPGGYFPSDYPVDIFLVGGLLFALALHPWSLLVNAATRFLGRVSYSIYLLHLFVLESLLKGYAALTHHANSFLGVPFGHFASFVVFFLVAVPCSLLVANLSWKYIEQPGIRAGQRLLKRLGRTAASRRSAILPGTTIQDDMSNAPL